MFGHCSGCDLDRFTVTPATPFLWRKAHVLPPCRQVLSCHWTSRTGVGLWPYRDCDQVEKFFHRRLELLDLIEHQHRNRRWIDHSHGHGFIDIDKRINWDANGIWSANVVKRGGTFHSA